MSLLVSLSTSVIAGAIGGLVAATNLLIETGTTTNAAVDKQYASLTATTVQIVAPSGETLCQFNSDPMFSNMLGFTLGASPFNTLTYLGVSGSVNNNSYPSSSRFLISYAVAVGCGATAVVGQSLVTLFRNSIGITASNASSLYVGPIQISSAETRVCTNFVLSLQAGDTLSLKVRNVGTSGIFVSPSSGQGRNFSTLTITQL